MTTHVINRSGRDVIMSDHYTTSVSPPPDGFPGNIKHHIGDKEVKRIKPSKFRNARTRNKDAHQWICISPCECDGTSYLINMSLEDLERYDECELELYMKEEGGVATLAYQIRQRPRSRNPIWGNCAFLFSKTY